MHLIRCSRFCNLIVSSLLAILPVSLGSHAQVKQGPCWSGEHVDESRTYCGVESMPVPEVFWIWSMMMNDLWPESSDAVALGDPDKIPRDEFAFLTVVQSTDLDEEEAEHMILKLRPLLQKLNEDIKTSQTMSLCVSDLSEWSSEKAIRAMYQLDDVRFAVQETYYRMALLSLSDKEEIALERLLSGDGFSASTVNHDYDSLYADDPGRARDDLEGLCRTWTSDSKDGQ